MRIPENLIFWINFSNVKSQIRNRGGGHFHGKETVVIFFIPNWNMNLLAGFGNSVKLEDIQAQSSKSCIRSNGKKSGY